MASAVVAARRGLGRRRTTTTQPGGAVVDLGATSVATFSGSRAVNVLGQRCGWRASDAAATPERDPAWPESPRTRAASSGTCACPPAQPLAAWNSSSTRHHSGHPDQGLSGSVGPAHTDRPVPVRGLRAAAASSPPCAAPVLSAAGAPGGIVALTVPSKLETAEENPRPRPGFVASVRPFAASASPDVSCWRPLVSALRLVVSRRLRALIGVASRSPMAP